MYFFREKVQSFVLADQIPKCIKADCPIDNSNACTAMAFLITRSASPLPIYYMPLSLVVRQICLGSMTKQVKKSLNNFHQLIIQSPYSSYKEKHIDFTHSQISIREGSLYGFSPCINLFSNSCELLKVRRPTLPPSIEVIFPSLSLINAM